MSKSREHVTTNGRAAFYACLWNDFRQAAMDKGWALGLHGSMASDLDIMAMPWTENAAPVDEMIHSLENCLTEPNKSLWHKTKKSTDKPNNRVVYTIHIFADFYLDVNIIEPTKTNSFDDLTLLDFLAQLVNRRKQAEQGFDVPTRWLCTRDDLRNECKKEALKVFEDWKLSELLEENNRNNINLKN